MKYKNIRELRSALLNFRLYNTLSSSEKAVYDALSKLDDLLKWKLYVALNEFIDKWLFVGKIIY